MQARQVPRHSSRPREAHGEAGQVRYFLYMFVAIRLISTGIYLNLIFVVLPFLPPLIEKV